MDFLAIISKTRITKYKGDIFKVISLHMLTSDVYCSIYSTFYHNPRNTTNYNKINLKKSVKSNCLFLCYRISFLLLIMPSEQKSLKQTFIGPPLDSEQSGRCFYY